jgi:hypothetical protein
MKKLLIIAILIGWGTGAWGGASVTVYVKAGNAGASSPYATPATAAATIVDGLTYAATQTPTATDAGAGHLVYINAGTYTDRVLITDAAKMGGASLIGCTDITSLGICTSAARDLVINQGDNTSGHHSAYVSAAPNVRFRNMTIWQQNTSSKAVWVTAAAGFDMQYCHLIQYAAASDTDLVLLASTSTGSIIKYNLFEGGTAGHSLYYTGGGGTVAYNIFRGNRALGSGKWKVKATFYNAATSPVYLYNNVFSDCSSDNVLTAEGGTTTVASNNIIYAPWLVTNKYGLSLGGTATESYNLVLSPSWSHPSVNAIGTGTIVNYDPKFTSSGKRGYIIPIAQIHMSPTSDSGYMTNALKAIGTLMKSYSMTGTYYLDYFGYLARDNEAEYRKIITHADYGSGVWEVGALPWANMPTDQVNVGAWTCTAGDCASARWRIHLVTGVPTLEIDIHGDLSVVYTSTGSVAEDYFCAPYKYIGDGTTAATPTIHCSTPAYQYGAANEATTAAAAVGTIRFTLASGAVPATKLSEFTMSDTWTAFGGANYMTLDRSTVDCVAGFFKGEICDAKTQLAAMINGGGNITDPQTGATYVTRSMYSGLNADFDTVVKAAGFITNVGTTMTYQDLTSLDFHNIVAVARNSFFANDVECTAAGTPYSCCTGSGPYTGCGAWSGGDGLGTWTGTTAGAAETTRLVGNLAAHAGEHGLVVGLLTQLNNGLYNLPLTGTNSLETVFAALYDAQTRGLIKVRSAQQVYDEMVASGLWTIAAGVATRTYAATAVDDNTLQSTSPARKLATPVGLYRDITGAFIPYPTSGGLNSAGAYQYTEPSIQNLSNP